MSFAGSSIEVIFLRYFGEPLPVGISLSVRELLMVRQEGVENETKMCYEICFWAFETPLSGRSVGD